MKFKRFLTILAVICLMAGVLAVSGSAYGRAELGDTGSCGENVTYSISLDGVLTISGTGDIYDYNPTYNSFSPIYGDAITSVVIQTGVTRIGDNFFNSCPNMTSITIAPSVTEIGERAFQSCTSLTSITLPKAMVSIEPYAFSGCTALSSINTPDSLQEIGFGAFENCDSLRIIPGVEMNGKIRWTLNRDTGLFHVTGSGNMPGFNVVYNNYPTWHLYDDTITSAVFDEGITSIGGFSFWQCENLKSVTIPSTVTEIGAAAFQDCTGLTSIKLPAGMTAIYDMTFDGCSGIGSFNIPAGVTQIGQYAFRDCTKLTSLTIPEAVTDIDSDAFANCTGLTTFTVPDAVTFLGSRVFEGCTGLKTVTLGSGLTQIYNHTFSGCSALTGVTFRGDITVVSTSAFANCTSLKSVKLPDSVIEINNNAFENCSAMTSFSATGALETIGEAAFSGCTSLTDVKLADSVTTMEKHVFYGCSALKSIVLPKNLKAVPFEGFYNCTSLSSVTLSDSLSGIYNYAFYGCTSLKSIKVSSPYCTMGAACLPDGIAITGYEDTPASEYAYQYDLTFNSLGKAHISLYPMEVYSNLRFFEYNGEPHTPTIKVTGLTEGEDFTVTYKNNINGGTATVIVTGIGSRTGTHELTFEIRGKDLEHYGMYISMPVTSYYYTGDFIHPEFTVTDGTITLVEGVDYIVPYYSRVPEIGWVTVQGIGNYSGELQMKYTILRAPLSNNTFSLSATEFTYNGSAHKPTVIAPEGLVEGTDYTVTYYNNTNAGTGTVTLTAAGYWTGTVSLTFTIKPAALPSGIFSLESGSYVYTGSAIWPTVVSSKEGVQYNVSYANNVNAGTGTVTVTARGNYTGTETLNFTISPKSVSDVNMGLSTTTYAYTGSAIQPVPYVNGLVKDRDYTLSYKNNVNAGTGTVTVTGKGNYTGTKSVTFTISPTQLNSSWFSLEQSQYPYTGSPVEPVVVAEGLTLGTDYTVSYQYNTSVGWGWAVVEGKGNYSGSVTLNFEIVRSLGAPTVSAVNVFASGRIKLSWKAVDGAASYQIHRAPTGSSTYTLLATTSETSYIDILAAAGEKYDYKVYAVGSDGTLSVTCGTASRMADLPRPVVKASNVASSGKVKLTWNKVEGAVKYKVFRSTSQNGKYILMKTVTGTSYVNLNAKAGVKYFYKVVAVASNTNANSAKSLAVQRTGDLARPVVKASNVLSSGKVKLTWNKVDGAVKYQIWRATAQNGKYYLMKTVTGTTYTNLTAKPGVKYFYKVIAVCGNTNGNSAASAIVSRVADCARPVVSVKLNANGKPRLTWNKVEGAVKYKVFRATSQNGNYILMKTVTGTSYVNLNAKKGVTYYYKVVAVCSNTNGNSAYSTAVSIKP